MRIRDFFCLPWIRDEKVLIRDKHPGSSTLVCTWTVEAKRPKNYIPDLVCMLRRDSSAALTYSGTNDKSSKNLDVASCGLLVSCHVCPYSGCRDRDLNPFALATETHSNELLLAPMANVTRIFPLLVTAYITVRNFQDTVKASEIKNLESFGLLT